MVMLRRFLRCFGGGLFPEVRRRASGFSTPSSLVHAFTHMHEPASERDWILLHAAAPPPPAHTTALH